MCSRGIAPSLSPGVALAACWLPLLLVGVEGAVSTSVSVPAPHGVGSAVFPHSPLRWGSSTDSPLRLRGGWRHILPLLSSRPEEEVVADPHPLSKLCSVSQAIKNVDIKMIPEGLGKVLNSIGNAVEGIAAMLRQGSGTRRQAGTSNTFGDEQLEVDLQADEEVFQQLKACGAVCMASSEETSEEVFCGGRGYAVAFDPLDGSSIVGANWAVGSIFGVYPDPGRRGFIGRKGSEQRAGIMAVYGPATTMAIGLRLVDEEARKGKGDVVLALEVSLTSAGWVVTKKDLSITEGRVFAPGNLRASQERSGYAMLLDYWLTSRYTLRYTGGLVPDVYYILTKGAGVFCNPSSPSHRPKLRLLYECAPIAMIVECAGGASTNGKLASLLDMPITSTSDVTDLCVGSPGEVRRYRALINAPNKAQKRNTRVGCLPFWPFSSGR